MLHRITSEGPLGWTRPAVSLGNFDGVHLGHARLVAQTMAEARALDGVSVVLTFDPHPARVLHPERAPRTLVTLEQKDELLAGLGLDRLAVLPFTRELAARPAEDFARDVLARCLGARVVVVGRNFRFGRGRSGDPARLAALGAALGFEVRTVEPVPHEGAPISSTRIREALGAGKVEAAAAMLGRPYFVDGTVEAGDGRGRAIGFPTANLAVVNETLPAGGVYACVFRAEGDGPRPAVANLGRRPTFGGEGERLEAHVLDFAGDLYGRAVRVAFVARLRGEQRFGSADELSRQIAVDVARAREALAGAL